MPTGYRCRPGKPRKKYTVPVFTNLSVYLADAAVACQKGKTYFLVARFTFRGGRDRICMWVNPTPGTPPADEQAAVDTEEYQVSPGQEVSLFVQPYGLGVYDVDELRVGPTFESVAPAGRAGSAAALRGRGK